MPVRTDQVIRENHRLGLPVDGGFVRGFVELEVEADRQAQIWARRAGLYSSLYVLLGLPAAVLAAIAGATTLASTTGRVVAGIIALTASALSAAVTFLDSAKKRDQAQQTRTGWDALYNDMHVCRLTELGDFTTDTGPVKLNGFYSRASAIRAGRNPDDEPRAVKSAARGDGSAKPLFPPRT